MVEGSPPTSLAVKILLGRDRMVAAPQNGMSSTACLILTCVLCFNKLKDTVSSCSKSAEQVHCLPCLAAQSCPWLLGCACDSKGSRRRRRRVRGSSCWGCCCSMRRSLGHSRLHARCDHILLLCCYLPLYPFLHLSTIHFLVLFASAFLVLDIRAIRWLQWWGLLPPF